MYSRFNLIIDELNSIRRAKLGDADIVSKTIYMLAHNKYENIITTLHHNMEDLSTMTLMLIISKLVAFEML
jgi:hypothetical protein